MPTLEHIYKTELRGAPDSKNDSVRILSDDKKRATITTWLKSTGFDDLRFVAAGTGSFILWPAERNDYVIRISPEKRMVDPHVIQPLYTKEFGELRLEIVPYLLRGTLKKKFELFPKFEQEITACGYSGDYEITNGEYRHPDLGIFEYKEPGAKGKKREVLMAVDNNVIRSADKTPRCTKEYPTFAVQWRRQCEIVKKDPRLQSLFTKGLPPKLPTTKIISVPSKGEKIL